jgi:hypothetical protein
MRDQQNKVLTLHKEHIVHYKMQELVLQEPRAQLEAQDSKEALEQLEAQD